VIKASTNLVDWVRVYTNTASTRVLFHTDLDAGNFNGRFDNITCGHFSFPG
jgi:hypothetical protein